jgi:hypothetical protein
MSGPSMRGTSTRGTSTRGASPHGVIRRAVPRARAVLAAFGALGALAALGCQWGTRPDRLAPALGPEGAQVAVRVTGEARDRVGELYASDSAGVLLFAGRLVRVPWPSVRALDVQGLDGAYDVAPGERPDAAKRGRLALVSRFPQGLAGELLTRTLAALGQPALEELP